MTKPIKFDLPKFDVVEHTALQFALTFYEAARSSGMKSKYKTARLWALHNYIKFIPKALDTLIDMLSRNDIHDNVKQKIHEAIIERTNDPVVNQVFPKENVIPEIDLKKILDHSPEKPINIITDYFKDKKSTKQKLLTGVSHG